MTFDRWKQGPEARILNVVVLMQAIDQEQLAVLLYIQWKTHWFQDKTNQIRLLQMLTVIEEQGRECRLRLRPNIL